MAPPLSWCAVLEHILIVALATPNRETIIMTSATGNQELPLVSKMVIFRNEVSEEYHKYILGLLSFNVSNIIISEDKLNSMRDQG